MSQTGGYGIMNHTFDSILAGRSRTGNPGRRNGAFVSY